MENKFLNTKISEENVLKINLKGKWDIYHLEKIQAEEKSIKKKKYKKVIIDTKNLKNFDTSGAWELRKLVKSFLKKKCEIEIKNFLGKNKKIFDVIYKIKNIHRLPRGNNFVLFDFFSKFGIAFTKVYCNFIPIFAFFGQFLAVLFLAILKPKNIRLRSIAHHINEIGIKAIPIIAVMAFLISIVTGYQGANQLSKFGATVFTIDLVTISVLREMSVLITAIMVAGRSGSAFTAQIGTMKLNDEIDAMKTISIDPFAALVLPRMIAITISLPFLTFIADIIGLLGGYFTAVFILDMSFLQFTSRIKEIATLDLFFVGIVKAPVFAILIGTVGCMRGMQVQNSAEEIGKYTTISVVQSIFLILLTDALFSILFSIMGI